MLKFSTTFKNVRVVKNQENLGLASSSNVALGLARAPYVLRLDADDFFVNSAATIRALNEIRHQKKDVIYPNNYFGSLEKIQEGSECHHVGGAIFKRSALNLIKFTDGLRGYEGLDLFERAKGRLSVGYLSHPGFFYRQRPDSMSKTNLSERESIKKEILK